jgi:aromatic-L-amino-acid/L-tryptophan decarboxylase
VGRRGYMKMIGDDIRLARRLYDLVDAHDELEPFTRDLSITTFRYVPPDLRPEIDSEAGEDYLNRLNQELLEQLQRSGELFVSNAVMNGCYVLRACIVNFHTDAGDIEAVPEIVVRHGRELDAAARNGS